MFKAVFFSVMCGFLLIGCANTQHQNANNNLAGLQQNVKLAQGVRVYGVDYCINCWRTRMYLSSHHIPYTFYNVETSPRGRWIYGHLGAPGVPIILVDQQQMIGFDKDRVEKALKKAGYLRGN